MLCHYWYFLDKHFSIGSYLCDGCYNITQKSNNFKNIPIAYVLKSTYRIYVMYMRKRKYQEAKKFKHNNERNSF